MNQHSEDTSIHNSTAGGETDGSQVNDAGTLSEPAGDDSTTSPAEPTLADPGQRAVDAFFGPPKLDRERPARPPLIPRWVFIAGACALAVGLFALGFGIWSSFRASIPTPRLVGIDVGTATARLAERGLRITVAEKRFSAKAPDTVLSQSPPAGTKLRSGDAVSVIVSAGSEQFAMPNVVGSGLMLAKGILGTKGLDVRIQARPSEQPSDTVLASNPPAGQTVHTGDIVLLTVAAPGPDTAVLLPYDMRGVTVLLDPAPTNDALSDAPLEIARRVRSLVEASHGKVVTTRALADTSTLDAEPARAEKAAATSSTVGIGFSIIPVGGAGMTVFVPSPILPQASTSAKLSSAVASDLASTVGPVRKATATTDTVLVAGGSPWTRVQLGALSQREDVAKFSDSSWKDSVARAIYKAIASQYGRKTEPDR